MNKILETLEAEREELADWRHDFHMHPELGLEETRTAGIVAQKLRSWGIEVTEHVGVTGVVGVINGDLGPGRSIGLRCDMDALPITECSSQSWKSTVKGKMHACGHDGHTTMLLAAARYLSQHRNFRGRVVLVFQPAEEGTGGALAMIKDGLFERFPMDEIYGMHNWTDVEPGTFSVKSGAAMAGSDFFTIKLHGKGAHGSAPQLSADAALAASLVTVALQQIVARNVAPLDSAVVSVTKIHTGSAFNIIPQEAELGGCTRFFSSETGAMLRRRIEEVAVSTAAACGVKAEVEFESIYAVLDNVPQLAEAMKKAAAQLLAKPRRSGPRIRRWEVRISPLCLKRCRAPTASWAVRLRTARPICIIPPLTSTTVFCRPGQLFGWNLRWSVWLSEGLLAIPNRAAAVFRQTPPRDPHGMLDGINRRAVFFLMGSIDPRIYLHQLFMSMVMRRAVDIDPSLRETTGTASHSRYIENGDCVISLTMPGERAEIEWRHYV